MPDYNPSIPTGAQNLSDSQVDILNNFTELNTIFNSDHFQWNFATTGDRGLHRRVSFPTPLASNPSVAGDDAVVYSKLVSGITQLFFKNATTTQQLSFAAVTSSGSNYGFTLANGVIINMGLSPSITPGSSQTVTLAIPFTTTFMAGVASAFDQDGRLNLSVSPGSGGGALTQIRLFAAAISGSSARQGFYIAIGV